MKKMQFSKIALATTLAIASIGAQAASGAFTLPTGTVTIYFSGASAPDGYLSDVASSMLTTPTGTDPITGLAYTGVVKFSQNNGSDSNYRAFFGKTSAAYGTMAAGTNVLLIKRSKSGSDAGVNPVATASRIEVLDLGNCDNTPFVAASGTVAATGAAMSGYAYGCAIKGSDNDTTTANVGMVPDFGASDVEPAMFKAPYNVTSGLSQLTSSQLGNLKSTSVNLGLFDISATDAVPASTYFSRAIYSALLTHKVDTWDQVDAVNNTATDSVVVCRRVNGSGTQASFNWFFTGFPCTKAFNGEAQTTPADWSNSTGLTLPVLDTTTVVAGEIVLDASGNNVTPGETFYGVKNTKASLGAMVPAQTAASLAHPGNGTGVDVYNPIWTDPAAGYTVVDNSGSGDVRNCLKAANNKADHIALGENVTINVFDGTTHSTVQQQYYGYAFGADATGAARTAAFKAVGVLGMDSMGQESGWHFRTLDGAGTVTPLNAGGTACTGKNTSATTACTQISVAGTGLAPTKANLINGMWDFAPELSIQSRGKAVVSTADGTVAALAGTKLGFFNSFVANLQSDKYTGNATGTILNGVPAYNASIPTALKPGNGTTIGYFTHGNNTCSPIHKF